MRRWFSRRRVLLAMGILAAATATVLTANAPGDDQQRRSRPLPPGFTEGFGNEKVLAFKYPQQFYCTDDLGDDLDGPGHRGDGLPAERDPDEFQHPAMGPPGSPCIVGDSGSGSLPRIDPTGRPVANAEKIWAIIPVFADAQAVQTQCPSPGPPTTQHRDAPATCVMHPSFLHAEPATAIAAGDIPLLHHSHIIDGDSFNPIWWQTIAVRVLDRTIWPDLDGHCPASPRGGRPCLTSLQALRDAQERGQAGPDTPTNVWLFFDAKPIDPQP